MLLGTDAVTLKASSRIRYSQNNNIFGGSATKPSRISDYDDSS